MLRISRSASTSRSVIVGDVSASQPLRETAEHGPLGRMGRPGEIANAVAWLISPEASFLTGSDIEVTGGV